MSCVVLRSENEVRGSLAGSVEQVEIAEPDQCSVLPQDVVGWWHAGQGVTDFDSGGDEVRWNYGHARPCGGMCYVRWQWEPHVFVGCIRRVRG